MHSGNPLAIPGSDRLNPSKHHNIHSLSKPIKFQVHGTSEQPIPP